MSLPTKRKEFQFEQATVIYSTVPSDVEGLAAPKLEVQVIDQYGFQRELSVQLRHRAGSSHSFCWEMHAYRHPGRRNIKEVPRHVAERFIARFLEICEKHPILLFNDEMPRSMGFVRLSECLLDGATLSVRLLM
jgi:hypothetical protein